MPREAPSPRKCVIRPAEPTGPCEASAERRRRARALRPLDVLEMAPRGHDAKEQADEIRRGHDSLVLGVRQSAHRIVEIDSRVGEGAAGERDCPRSRADIFAHVLTCDRAEANPGPDQRNRRPQHIPTNNAKPAIAII